MAGRSSSAVEMLEMLEMLDMFDDLSRLLSLDAFLLEATARPGATAGSAVD